MNRAFTESYDIEGSHTTYHGTSVDTSTLITTTGFKGVVCQHTLFDKGVYTSPDVWEVLPYDTPTSDVCQIVFVVSYLQGPYAWGVQNQVCVCVCVSVNMNVGLVTSGVAVFRLTSVSITPARRS